MRALSHRYFIILSFTGFSIALISLVGLSARPFGFLFWGSVYLTVTCISLALTGLCWRLFMRKRVWSRFAGALVGLLAFLTAGSFLSVQAGLFASSGVNMTLSQTQWEQDLDYLLETIAEKHPSGAATSSQHDFRQAVEGLRLALPELTTHQKIVAFNRLIAFLNDGHSSMWPLFSPANFSAFPIKTYNFDDGLYIIDASRAKQNHIGAKLVGIEDFSIEEVREKIRTITGAENEAGEKVRFSMYLTQAELLAAEGIIQSAQKATFYLENPEGQVYPLVVMPEPANAWMFWTFYRIVDKHTSPAFQNIRSDFYWFDYDDATATLYLQFNLVQDKLLFGESIADITLRLETFIADHKIDTFIVDLRNNNGGNAQLVHPFIDMLANNDKINQRGKLFTVIGRHTFSAAVLLAAALENRTKTLFVGESMGSTVNLYGDADSYYLPNSGLRFLLSRLYWQNSIAEDVRATIQPDLPTGYSYQDYLAKRDPALEAIRAYRKAVHSYTEIPVDHHHPVSGRYQLSNTQIATIEPQGSRLKLHISDFSPQGFSQVDSSLYLASENEITTDIQGVRLIRQGGETWAFDWQGVHKPLVRIGEKVTLPMELLNRGKHREAFAAIKAGYAIPAHLNREMVVMNIAYYFMDKDLSLAEDIFHYNTQQYQTSSYAQFHLGEAFLAADNLSAARQSYLKATKMDPQNQRALDRLEELAGS